MGTSSYGKWARTAAAVAGVASALALAGGCAPGGAAVSTAKLIQHQSMVSAAGLREARTFVSLKASIATPMQWAMLPEQRTALYLHQQWRSPTRRTGVGVAYVRLPIPLGAKALIWFAKREYAKGDSGGEVLGEWTDDAGRQWFEARDSRYHVRGYAVVHGTDAWFVYCGYKTARGVEPDELNVAARCAETVLPLPLARKSGQSPVALAR